MKKGIIVFGRQELGMERVLHYVAIMNRAGEETFIMNVFRSIDRSRVLFDFLVTVDQEGDYDSEIKELGGRIRHLPRVEKGGPLKRIVNFMRLCRFLKPLKDEYAAFHIHTQHAMDATLDAMAAKLAGFRKVIVHSHSTSTQFHIKAHYIFRPILNNMRIYRFACSDLAGKWLYGEKGRFHIINNGIRTDDFLYSKQNRDRIRSEEGWGDHRVIGHVGSFTYPKNHAFLLEIFKAFLKYDGDAVLAMAGKGELMDQIREKAEELGIADNVRFLGSRGDVNALYSAFDALLFPSHYEGLPVTLVEAQASGLPCLISDVITKETDIIPELQRMSLEQSPGEWAEKLYEMACSGERKNMKEQIIRSGFDIKKTARKLLRAYTGR